MDLERRDELDRTFSKTQSRGDTLPVVGLEEFFEGNTDNFSIAANLSPHPGVETFYRVLRSIRDRSDVQALFVEIDHAPFDPENEEDDDLWLYSCVVFIVTSAPLDQVRQWLEPLQPDLVHDGWNVGPGIRTPLTDDELQANMKVVRVWWD